MNTVLNTIVSAIVLTTISAGSALACDTLDSKAQSLNNDQQKEPAITLFECDKAAEVDAIAEELRSRLNNNESVFNKIIKSASNPFKDAPNS